MGGWRRNKFLVIPIKKDLWQRVQDQTQNYNNDIDITHKESRIWMNFSQDFANDHGNVYSRQTPYPFSNSRSYNESTKPREERDDSTLIHKQQAIW